ncbi:hypothetical protein REPUB_Repub01dG0199200 [Reevesia pubescens]
MAEDLESLWARLSLTENERLEVTINNEAIENTVAEGKLCLLGKAFTHKVVNREVMRLVFSKVWKLKGDLLIQEIHGISLALMNEKVVLSIVQPLGKEVECHIGLKLKLDTGRAERQYGKWLRADGPRSSGAHFDFGCLSGFSASFSYVGLNKENEEQGEESHTSSPSHSDPVVHGNAYGSNLLLISNSGPVECKVPENMAMVGDSLCAIGSDVARNSMAVSGIVDKGMSSGLLSDPGLVTSSQSTDDLGLERHVLHDETSLNHHIIIGTGSIRGHNTWKKAARNIGQGKGHGKRLAVASSSIAKKERLVF